MALSPRLDLRQHQTLVMTPQLRQAIQLLQYSNFEANQFIEEELLKNPLLAHADSGAPMAYSHTAIALYTREQAVTLQQLLN